MSVTVYSTPSCVACKQTYRVLDKLGVNYQIVDMSADAAVVDRFRAMGFAQAPVVEANGDTWTGFRPDKLNMLSQVAA